MSTLQQLFGGYQENSRGTPEGYGPEQGVDIGGLPAGTPVRLPEDAYYQLGDSTNYQSVFQSARTNEGLSFTHIDALQFANNALIKAGTIIGTISAKVGWPVPDTGGTYYSSGPHLEVGVYASPADARNWNYKASFDPVVYYANENTMPLTPQPTPTQLPTTATQAYNPNNVPPQSTPETPAINNVPIVGGVWQAISSPFSSIGSDASNIGATLQSYAQLGTDTTTSFDKIVRWLPAAFIIIVIGFAYGKAKHG